MTTRAITAGALVAVAGIGIAATLALRESAPPGTPFPGPCRTLTDMTPGPPVETTFR